MENLEAHDAGLEAVGDAEVPEFRFLLSLGIPLNNCCFLLRINPIKRKINTKRRTKGDTMRRTKSTPSNYNKMQKLT